MTEDSLMTKLSAAITALGAPYLPAALAELLRSVVPCSYIVVFGYCGAARPIDLYDDFPAGKRKIFVTDYQDGPYLLDPFFLAATQPVAPGLYRMRDLAPDRFYQGEYFRNYYVQTGLAEEIGFFIDLPGGATVVLSMMATERPFSTRDLRLLRDLRPVIEACVKRHWPDLSERFVSQGAAGGRAPETQIDLSFQTFGNGILTPREKAIVEFTLKGHSADATGRILGITPGTVRIHRRNIYAKLQISSQGELFSRFIATLGGS